MAVVFISPKKRQELNELGHDVFRNVMIPDEFKEYLKRLRENVHGAKIKE